MVRVLLICAAVAGVGLLALDTAWAGVAKRVVRVEQAGPDLLKDGGWTALGGARRQGELFVCDNGADAKAERGFAQTIILNQREPAPILATVESKAENVGGQSDSDYALYLDIIYADGEPLWGQIHVFRAGSGDWQRGTVKIIPAKPIKQVSYYLLLRRSHSGRAIFRQPRLFQSAPAKGAVWFDGLQVLPVGEGTGGFAIRDVAADSDVHAFEQNGTALGLKLESSSRTQDDVTHVSATLRDTSGKDRAVTLVYTVPVSGQGWRWLADPRRDEPTSTPREYVNASRFATVGSSGMLSRYPFAAVAQETQGQGIGLELSKPAFYRVGFSAGTGELYIAYDLGLTPQKPSAQIGFCVFSFDAVEGFRSALARYYAIYPQHFVCRTPQQGLWMPFAKISQVQNWQDFGFRFKEGNDETAWDDAHGILTFRYTEPMTWWMTMPKGTPRTLDAAVAEAQRRAKGGDAQAQALLSSGYYDPDGRLVGLIRNEPWCDGIVWSMNSAPSIAGAVTDFATKWNPKLMQELYGGQSGDAGKGMLDGEYVDSSEGYVTAELDFRRDHFASMNTPLTFSTEGHRPAVFRGLIAYEYVHAIAQDVHAKGRLMMANATPISLCWLAPDLDVMGTETDWNPGGTWRPMSDADLLYRRAMCGPKPYCFLMNTRFEQFPRALVEKYMKRALAYGMFPGFFSHNASEAQYFTQPALYNRDRILFRKYVPLCKLVAEAGWRPITGAVSSDPRVYVERFGEKYLTVFNDSPERRSATITLRQPRPVVRCRELVSGQTLPMTDASQITVALDGEDVAVLELE